MLNALLLIGFLYVATTVVDDAGDGNLRYEHTIYRYNVVEDIKEIQLAI